MPEVKLSSNWIVEAAHYDVDRFTFLVGDTEYEVSRLQACFFSGKVQRLLASDVTIDRVRVNVDGDSSIFDFVIALMSGRAVDVNDTNVCFLGQVSIDLDNRELFDHIYNSELTGRKLTVRNVIERIMLKKDVMRGYDDEIEFVALHFAEVSSGLHKLGDDDVDAILSSPLLRVINEDYLFAFILTRCDPVSNDLPLLRHIRPEHLSEDRLTEYLSLAKTSRYVDVWEVIHQSMLTLASSHRDQRRELCPFRYIETEEQWNDREGRYQADFIRTESERQQYREQDDETKFKGIPHDGIFGYFRSKLSGNLHQNRFVCVTASSTSNYPPIYVTNRAWTGCWYSRNEHMSWIMFDFQEKSVTPTHYSLRYHSANWPKIWEVSGSDDGQSWIVIDRRNTHALSDAQCHAFQCLAHNHQFRLIRLTQLGTNNGNGFQFYLSEVEFFGTVRDVSDQSRVRNCH